MANWKNRIVGHGEEAPDQLLANPKNWRTHPKEQQAALGGLLKEVGVVQSVIVNKRTGYVVDGHARIGLAMKEGQKSIPVVYVDLSDEEEALVLATLDPIGALAGRDAAQLEALLQEVSTEDADLQQLLDALIPQDLPEENGEPVQDEGDSAYQEQYGVIVMCRNAKEQEENYNHLVSMGYECKVVCT